MGNTQMPVPATALDHESTIVTAVELTASSWLVGGERSAMRMPPVNTAAVLVDADEPV